MAEEESKEEFDGDVVDDDEVDDIALVDDDDIEDDIALIDDDDIEDDDLVAGALADDAVVVDDDDDDAVVADDDDDDDDGPAPARKPGDEEEEDDDDEVEADLDAILKDRLTSGDDEEEDDDEDGPAPVKVAPLSPDDVPAKSEDERTCESCWLIKPLIQFPDDGPICIDCA